MNGLVSLSISDLTDLFSEIATATNSVLWIRNAMGDKQLYLSPSYQTLWQRPPQELYEHPGAWSSYLDQDYDSRLENKIKESILINHHNINYYPILRPDHQRIWIKDQILYLYNDTNQRIAIMGLAQAVSCPLKDNENAKDNNLQLEKTKRVLEKLLVNNLELTFAEQEQSFGQNTALPFSNSNTKRFYFHNNLYLSLREAQCLYFVIKGYETRDIASLLSLSKRTVESYIENIKSKFGCRKLTTLVAKALISQFRHYLAY